MALKLKQYVSSRVLSYFKPHQEQLVPILPKSIEINTKGGQCIEFHLDLRCLKELTDSWPEVFQKLKTLSPDFLIESTSLIESKHRPKLVFKLSNNVFIKEVVDELINKTDIFGNRNKILNNPVGRRVIVEFSSPNIAKPFHVGHLRSTIIGNFLSKLHEYLTFDVVKLNYLGDWGTQMGMLAVGLDILKYSDETVKQNPISSLYEAYVRAHEEAEDNPDIHLRAKKIFEQMEKSDTVELERWEMFRKYSLSELDKTYRRLGIHYDDFYWESMYKAKDIGHIIEQMKSAGIIEIQDDGRCMIDLKGRKIPIIKSDGTMLYLTRDIAGAIDRYKRYNFDEMIYVVENGQSDHMATLFQTLKKLNLQWADNLKHVKFGRIHGMSTRKGNVVFLKDVLDEAKHIMKDRQEKSPTTRDNLPEETADILGMSAVIINDLKQRRLKDYEFNWNKALQVEGDTGIRLQYTHCRLWSLEKNCGVALTHDCDPSALKEDEAINLITQIGRFEEVLLATYNEYEACHLVQYLFQLCNAINKAFNVLQVKRQDTHTASQRMMVFHAARITLNQGMRILGLKPLEEM